MDWLINTGIWDIIGQVDYCYLGVAIARLKAAIKNSDYDLFFNNCEQFARYIAEGEHYSTQLRWAGVAVTLIALTIYEWE